MKDLLQKLYIEEMKKSSDLSEVYSLANEYQELHGASPEISITLDQIVKAMDIGKAPRVVFDLDDVVFDMKTAIKDFVKKEFDIILLESDFKNYLGVAGKIKFSDVIKRMKRDFDLSKMELTEDCQNNKRVFPELVKRGYYVSFSSARQCWGKESKVRGDTEEALIKNGIYDYNRVYINPVGDKLKGIPKTVALVDDREDNLIPYLDTNIKLFLLTKEWNKSFDDSRIIRIFSIAEVLKWLWTV